MKEVNIPKHIAIIMDGNGRWAKQRKIAGILGYQQGIETAERIVKYSKSIGVKYLTLYAFSLENWERPKHEVDCLMDMFRNYLKRDVKRLIKDNIRVIFIGNHDKLKKDIKQLMKKIEEESSKNYFYLIIAMSYGAKSEILDATIKFSKLYSKNQHNNEEKLQKLFASIINPHQIPDPDLLIRTSGEKRLSNFLLWQIAYTELFFADKLWPDFNEYDLMLAIQDYNKRERKYGK